MPTQGRPLDVLLAHSYFLYYDSKQVRKMRPYPPLATLITAAVLRDAARTYLNTERYVEVTLLPE